MRALTVFGLLLMLALPAVAQASDSVPVQTQILGGELSVRVLAGALRFPPVALAQQIVRVRGSSAPIIEVLDARGTGQGWSLSLQAEPLLGPKSSLPPHSLHYRAAAGRVTSLRGQRLMPGGPRETGHSGNLDRPLRVLVSQPGTGMGTYAWSLQASSFELEVPPQAFAGRYQGRMVVSITSGP